MPKNEKPEQVMTPWRYVAGSVSTYEREQGQPWTVFSLAVQAYPGGPVWAQRVEVETARLRSVEGKYQAVLDQMASSIAGQVER